MDKGTKNSHSFNSSEKIMIKNILQLLFIHARHLFLCSILFRAHCLCVFFSVVMFAGTTDTHVRTPNTTLGAIFSRTHFFPSCFLKSCEAIKSAHTEQHRVKQTYNNGMQAERKNHIYVHIMNALKQRPGGFQSHLGSLNFSFFFCIFHFHIFFVFQHNFVISIFLSFYTIVLFFILYFFYIWVYVSM